VSGEYFGLGLFQYTNDIRHRRLDEVQQGTRKDWNKHVLNIGNEATVARAKEEEEERTCQENGDTSATRALMMLVRVPSDCEKTSTRRSRISAQKITSKSFTENRLNRGSKLT